MTDVDFTLTLTKKELEIIHGMAGCFIDIADSIRAHNSTKADNKKKKTEDLPVDYSSELKDIRYKIKVIEVKYDIKMNLRNDAYDA